MEKFSGSGSKEQVNEVRKVMQGLLDHSMDFVIICGTEATGGFDQKSDII